MFSPCLCVSVVNYYSPSKLLNSALEAESQLQFNVATGSRLTSRTAAEAESSGARHRLPEERRTKIADRVAKIRMIEKVQDVYRDRQVITAVRRASASEVSAAATTTSTSTAASATTATCA